MLKIEVFYSGNLNQTALNSVYTPMYLLTVYLRTFMLSFHFHYNKSFPLTLVFLDYPTSPGYMMVCILYTQQGKSPQCYMQLAVTS